MDENKIISVLLVDDHPIVLNGLKSLLGDVPGIEIVSEACNGKEALIAFKNKPVDMIISDISMPQMDGIELAGFIKKNHPSTKVMLLTAFNEKEILKKALFSGAEACLIKNTSKKELLNAIYKVMDNGYYYCDNLLEIARNISHDHESVTEGTVHLTSRELDILELLLKGYSSKEIADDLSISYHTVATHRKNIMKKTETTNISGLYNFVRKNNLFPLFFQDKE